jgi:hypothetical protein
MATQGLSRIPGAVITLLITQQMERTSKDTHPITKTLNGAVCSSALQGKRLGAIKNVNAVPDLVV